MEYIVDVMQKHCIFIFAFFTCWHNVNVAIDQYTLLDYEYL